MTDGRHKNGFTIIELLVVIVVIGVLAAITLITYTGISQRAIVASLQSDLANAAGQLKIFQLENNTYPATIRCDIADSSTNKCLKSSSGNSYTGYTTDNSTNPPKFSLTETNTNGTSYTITDSGGPTLAVNLNCPVGFITVPGSSTYSTSSFCVMKYEAKNVGGIATSQAAGTPWVSISQSGAISAAAATCSGCHLITEAEWMTIAQNVLNVASNWSSGTIGNGYIYSGHNDDAPDSSLAADSNDSNGYAGETNTGGDQRRTLTLSNGQVIWDLAGNVWEWTNATIAGGQQPGLANDTGYIARDWTSSLIWNGLPVLSRPASTGLVGSGSWDSSYGIGDIASNYNETTVHGYLRGGDWYNGDLAGVLALNFNYNPGPAGYNFGFRVAK